MPKLTGLDSIINSGQMRTAYRILTTNLQWPDGDPPFPVGQYVQVPVITGSEAMYDPDTFVTTDWTNCTNIINDYHITQDSSMQIDAASLSVPVAWKSSLATVWREMRAVCIQERYSDGIYTTEWNTVFWGISDGYTESWNGNQHTYVVNVKDALKLANIEYLGTGSGSIVYQPDIIKVGSITTHYDMDLVNTATDAFEFGVCVTQGNAATAVHPNWADKPGPQFYCHNARDKDGNVSTEPIPLAIGGSAVNVVFGEGLVRVGINWARTTSAVNGVTDYSQGLGLGPAEVPDIRCILFRFAHPEITEGFNRTPAQLTVVSDTVEGLHIESSSAGQVVLNAAVSTHGLTLMLNDGTGKRYRTTTTGATTATLTLTNTSVIVPVNTPVTYGDANKVTTVIQRMLLDCGYQQSDSTAPLYINNPDVPLITGLTRDLTLPPLVYSDTDRVYPIAAIESLRQSGYIPPNYYVRANASGQIEASSIMQLVAGDTNIINIGAIPANPGIEYDRNDLDISTRVVARGIARQVTDYTQVAGVTIADVSEANGGLPTPAYTLAGQALRSGGDHVEGNYQYDLVDLFQRYGTPSTAGMDLRPWGWYLGDSNPTNGIAKSIVLNNQWKNKILAEITLDSEIEINAIEMWFPNPWLSDPWDWGLGYHWTNVFHYGPRMEERIDKRAHYDPQTIAIEYYDSAQENWLPLINNLVCPISMDSQEYIKRVESEEFATREAVISSKLRIVCIDPFFAEFGITYHSVIGVFLSQFKVWGSVEIRGIAELGSAGNYESELSAEPWPTIKKRIRKRTHILSEAVPWVNNTNDANWLAIEWLKQKVMDLAPRKLSAIRPDVRLWDTVTVTTPGGIPIDYIVTATDHNASGITSITAVSYDYPYFDEFIRSEYLPDVGVWDDKLTWDDTVEWKR